MRKMSLTFIATAAFMVLTTGAAYACGGLIAPNGGVALVRTSTLAAYHGGIEHYITAFEFAGAGGNFGSITPLPGIPSEVVKGGRWTLQRLALETQPPVFDAAASTFSDGAAAGTARVVMKTQVDSLDITVLEGGADEVVAWAEDNGFELSPDAPEVLGFYARRSPIFMAVRFNATRAAEQGLGTGDSTPVHVVIPTPNPWVPLRILALAKGADAPVEADVYLLTGSEPSLLPRPAETAGLVLERSEPASTSLLADLRSDRGMEWLPAEDMWLTYLRVDATADQLTYDLAVDASGLGAPSPVAAGFSLPSLPHVPGQAPQAWVWVLALLASVAGIAAVNRMVMRSA